MSTVPTFKKDTNQTVRLPVDTTNKSVGEPKISVSGNTSNLCPNRPSWLSLAELPKVDADYLTERSSVITDEGRYKL